MSTLHMPTYKMNLSRDFVEMNIRGNLEMKLQNLKFVKGKPINSFATEIRNTIRAFYGIQDSDIFNDLAKNSFRDLR